MASWRCFSALTAAAYSSFPSTLFGEGMSFTVFGSARLSRGGMEARTDANPAPAEAMCTPAASAKSESLCVSLTRFLPHLRKAWPASPSQSTLSMC
ncbi:hypothetical protein CP975_26385 [Streptomyces alboniger]|uniref:Uncharacterized protein n=1 Tax=Streptomyces alboniger TaxID=132473 RepID=A0A5J6HQJ3_STRAD|nr:hypothetical protein CP975_26385 [Streptomyces alboniger]